MPIHDDYLRKTPYERLMPDSEFPDRHFEAIVSEAEERKLGLEDTGSFAMLEATGAAIEELRPRGADAEATHTHAILLFHAFHLHRTGARHRLATTAACRWSVETRVGSTSRDRGPAAEAPEVDALYWQLPQHLFFVRPGPDDAPASLDGFFRTRVGDTIHVLGVTNVLGDRAGFDILPVPPAPAGDEPEWAVLDARPDEPDFHCTIPGSELENLYEVRTIGEMLKLLARLERLATDAPDALEELDPATGEPDARPTPSALPGHRLVLR